MSRRRQQQQQQQHMAMQWQARQPKTLQWLSCVINPCQAIRGMPDPSHCAIEAHSQEQNMAMRSQKTRNVLLASPCHLLTEAAIPFVFDC